MHLINLSLTYLCSCNILTRVLMVEFQVWTPNLTQFFENRWGIALRSLQNWGYRISSLKVFHKKLKIECIDVLRFLKLKVFEGFLDATFEIFDPSKKLFNTYILKFPLLHFFKKLLKCMWFSSFRWKTVSTIRTEFQEKNFKKWV